MFKYKSKFLLIIKTISILSFFFNISFSFANDFFVKDIIISGERRLSEGFILKYVPKSDDGIFNDQILNSITKNLFMSGYFSDVKITVNKSILEIIVEEFPIINEISFVGNDYLDKDMLTSIVNIKSRDTYNKESLKNAIENIRTAYQKSGRYMAEINIKETDLSDGRVNLIFEIIEGSLLTVQNINFIGNIVFSDNELKSVITTKEDTWYKIFGSNKYVPGRVEFDKEKLYSFYKERGYINFDIKLARGDLLPDFSGFNINFVLEEGARFKINDISIKSNLKDISKRNLINELSVKSGDYFNTRALDQSSVYINDYYSNFCYSFVKTTHLLNQNKDVVNIVFNVDEGNKTYINKIELIGNTRTTDAVIRRELTFLEGNSFNKLKLTESMKALKRLGYFKSVDYRIDRTNQANSVDIIIKVRETTTGSVSMGIGYSSLNQSSVTFGLNEKNFLGEGLKTKFEVSSSSKKTTYNVGFTEPYYLDKPIALSAGIFNIQSENSKGDIKAKKSGFRMGLGITEHLKSHNLKYSFNQSETTTSVTSTADSITGEEAKNIITSGLTYSLSKNTTDSFFNPTSGYLWNINNTLAGIGGDSKFIKSTAKYKVFFPINYGDYIVGIKSGIGFVSSFDDKVTSSNRFNLSGNTIRGFDNAGIGPRDTGNKAVVGGNNFYNVSFELRSDKFMPEDTGIGWLLFTDIGSLWGTDYETGVQGFDDMEPRITSGLGLSMNTAVGPLQVLWGFPLQSKSYDVEENFQFSIGTTF